MSKRGRMVEFHGAFSSKARALAKEARHAGAYIQRVKIKGRTRYLVLTRK